MRLYLVSAGRGPAALDVTDVLRAGETWPLRLPGTGCLTRPALLPASSRQDARLTLGTEPLFTLRRLGLRHSALPHLPSSFLPLLCLVRTPRVLGNPPGLSPRICQVSCRNQLLPFFPLVSFSSPWLSSAEFFPCCLLLSCVDQIFQLMCFHRQEWKRWGQIARV